MDTKLPATLDECHLVINELREALDARDIIGQAKGILMATEGIRSDEAFLLLAQASQRGKRRLRDVATELVGATADRCEGTGLEVAAPAPDEPVEPKPPHPFQIDAAPQQLSVCGEVDLSVTPALLEAILCAGLPSEGSTLVVDLARVTFLDSTGISALIEARTRLASDGVEMRVANPGPFVRQTLDLGGVSEYLGVQPPAPDT